MSYNHRHWMWFSVNRTLPCRLPLLILALLLTAACSEEEVVSEGYFPAIRIKVLNGCGFHGAAAEMANYLTRNTNVDVIGVGNADSFGYSKTIIVARKDLPEELERLKRYTNIERHAYAVSRDANESFQIIVGMDYLNYTN